MTIIGKRGNREAHGIIGQSVEIVPVYGRQARGLRRHVEVGGLPAPLVQIPFVERANSADSYDESQCVDYETGPTRCIQTDLYYSERLRACQGSLTDR